MSKYKMFKIAIPTDAEGFVGRACDAPGCKQYFKIYVPDHGDYLYCPYCGASFKTSPFARSLRQAQILILEISNIFLWLKFSPFLTSNKIEHFETGSVVLNFPGMSCSRHSN